MKSIILSLFLFVFFNSGVLGQEVTLNFKVEQDSKRIKKRTYSISNEVSNDIAILVREKKIIRGYLLDENFKNKSYLKIESTKKKKYNMLAGSKVNGSQYALVYGNYRKDGFSILVFDFDSKKAESIELKIEFSKNERYLKSISHKNKFYILSSNFDNDIFIRELDDDYNFKIIKKISLKELNAKQRLFNGGFFSTNGFFLLNKTESNIAKIDNRIPNALEKTSSNNKVYKQNGNLYLTFDNKDDFTLMYIINFDSLEVEVKRFDYPVGKIDDFKSHNSYFIDDILFQIGSSKKEMKLVVKDIDGVVKNSFYYNKDMPIDIRNSAITQNGPTALPFVTKRELDETSKYLRKVSSGNVGLNVYKKDGAYYTTIGGVKQVSAGGAPIISTPTATTFNGVGGQQIITTFNPTYHSFSTYSSTKSTYFLTKFDSNFNYVKDVNSKTVFEKIEDYKKGIKYITGEDLFFHNEKLYFGYFNLKEGEFNLVRF